MADQTKKIIFEAQDTGVQTVMDRLRKTAEETAGNLIRGARQYSTSGKEVLDYLEKEIQLVEKRNKLETRARQTAAEILYARKMERTPEYLQPGVTAEYKKEAGRITEEGRLEELQVALLRELIETVKATAREEIREDRKGVEEALSKDKTVTKLGIASKEEATESLKKTIQYEAVGSIKENEQVERNRFKFGSAAGRGFNAMASVGMQPNEFYMGAALLAMIPIVGLGLSAIGGKLFSSAQGYETALGGYGAITGSPIFSNIGMGTGYSRFGLSASQATTRAVAFARARGELGPDFWGSMNMNTMYMRGFGLSESDLLQNERLGRGGQFLGSAVPMNLFSRLVETGVMKGKDTSLLPEYLQLMNQLGQQQIDILGSIDQGINTNVISAIASMGGSFANPDVLKRLVPSFQQGLSRPVNAGVRALQLYTLQRANPNMSLLELEMQQEQGLSAMNGTYLTEFLKVLRARSGGNKDLFVRNIAGSFGTSLNIAKQVAEGFDTGKLSSEQIQGLFKSNVGKTGDLSRSLQMRAEGNVGALEKSTAVISTFFEKNGENMVKYLKGIEENLDKWLKMIIEGGGNPEKNMTKEERAETQKAAKKEREKLEYIPYTYQFSPGIF